MKVRALYWWIDRWRKSTAYTDMTLEQQGAYRNLLDEAALRGGALPLDERAIAKASGDAMRWPKLRAIVMRRFVKLRDGWHNETLDIVLAQTTLRANRQRAWRQASGNPVAETDDERRRRDRARHLVTRAIKTGRLKRGPCEVCGALDVHAHHDDYDKPLQVRWLCQQHHQAHHNNRRVRVTSSASSP